MNGPPSHPAPIPTLLPVTNTFRPRLPPPGGDVFRRGWEAGGDVCEKLEARSPLRAPAARHRDCSNTASGFDVGLTAKFVLSKSVGFSFSSPTGERGSQQEGGGGQEVRTVMQMS